MSTTRKVILALVAAPLLLIVVLVAVWSFDWWRTGDNVARNVTVAGVAVGGDTHDELQAEIEALADELPETPVEIDADADYQLTTTAGDLGLSIDAEATTDAVMAIGRHDPLPRRPIRWLISLFSERSADVVVDVDAEELAGTLTSLQGDRLVKPVEPSLEATEEGIVVTGGTDGTELTVNDVVSALPRELGDVSETIVIEVDPTVTEPAVSAEQIKSLAEQANEISNATITLNTGGQAVEVDGKDFRPAFALDMSGDTPQLTMEPDPVSLVLLNNIPTRPNPTGVRFDFQNGAMVPVGGEDTQVCCTQDAPQILIEGLLAGQTTIDLPTRAMTAQEGRDWAAGLGVTEVVGSFTTKHKCCQNRVTNIHTMADTLRGTLIPPGATFSVNETVGRRTTAKGYLEDGVIQDGEFTTDVGGGVSQFATTLFNAAFFGGFDIPTYKAHSKYISRYPFGREATLSYPGVDLKIRNNTPYGIVIWPTYSNTSITVDLWSTRFATGEQTGQNRASGCGSVSTERTRTFVDGHTETDTFRANYDCESTEGH